MEDKTKHIKLQKKDEIVLHGLTLILKFWLDKPGKWGAISRHPTRAGYRAGGCVYLWFYFSCFEIRTYQLCTSGNVVFYCAMLIVGFISAMNL